MSRQSRCSLFGDVERKIQLARTKTKQGADPQAACETCEAASAAARRALQTKFIRRVESSGIALLASGGPGAVPSSEQPPATRNPPADPGLMNNPCDP